MPRKTPLKLSLGNKIKELRIKNNLTQSELGEKLNVGKTAIANYESGYSEPDNDKLVALASFFNVSIDFLMGITTHLNPKKDIEDDLYKLNLSNEEFSKLVSMINDGTVPSTKFLMSKKNDKLTEACKICSSLEWDYTPIYNGEQEESNLLHKENHEKVKNILLSLEEEKIVHNASTTYTSSDDSMLPLLGVGDVAYIYLKNTYDSGETILFKLDDKEYVRKIIDKNDTVEFQAMNPYYPTMEYTKEELKKHDFTVIGKVIQVQNKSAFK